MRPLTLSLLVVLGAATTAWAQNLNPPLAGCATYGAQDFELGLRIDDDGIVPVKIWEVATGTQVYSFTATDSYVVPGSSGCNWVAYIDGNPPSSVPGVAELHPERLYRIDIGARSYYYEVEMGGPQGEDIFSPRGVSGDYPDVLFIRSPGEFRVYPVRLGNGASGRDVDDFFTGDWVLPYDLPTICATLGCNPEDDTDYPFLATTPYTTAAPSFPITLRSSGTEDWIVPSARSYDWSSADVAEIQFAETGVEIKGDLDVTGMTFTGSDASGWSGIWFQPGSGGSFSNVVIEGVGGSGGNALRIDNASPTFSTVTINNPATPSSVGGVYVSGAQASPDFHDLRVENMTWTGVSVYGYAEVRMTDSNIQSTGRTGLVAGTGADVFLYPSLSGDRTEGNQITDNAASGLYASNTATATFGYYYYPTGGVHNDGFNSVTGNQAKGVFAAYNGTVAAGNATNNQRNRFFSNVSFDAYSTQSGSAAYVRCDWWNDTTPPFRTATTGSAFLDDSAWLLADPYVNPAAPCTSGSGAAFGAGTDGRAVGKEGGAGTRADRLGAAMGQMDQPDAALAALSALIGEAPGTPEEAAALSAIGRLAVRPDAPSGARSVLDGYATAGPLRGIARQARVGLRYRAGDVAGALAEAETLLADPVSEADLVFAHSARVVLLSAQGRDRAALQAYRALAEIAPGSEEADQARVFLDLPLDRAAESATVASATSALATAPAEPAAGFAVEGVYPNPTAGAARVVVSVGERSRVAVSVFDVLGRRVAEAEGAFEPGTHTVRLATDRLVPGAYIVHVEATGPAGVVVESRRLTVVR